MRKLGLTLVIAVLLPANAARAQLRSVDLAFRPPPDARVVGFHVYVATRSQAYADYRDDINYVPPADANGVATYALGGIEALSSTYVSLKSYDAIGTESGFSNEIVIAAQPQCVATGCSDGNPCTVDRCTATGCVFDSAPLVGSACDDGDAMTFGDACQPGGGCAGTLAQCNSDADCPAAADPCAGPGTCVAHMCRTGQSPQPDEAACDDGDASTRYDVCRSGSCVGFACGSDSQCSDGEACNGAERCVGNACVSGTPMVCSDGNLCNGAETCRDSACVSGAPLACPSNQGPCFASFCDPSAGCGVQIYPDGTSCATSASGSAGTCSAGVCVVPSTSKAHRGHRNRTSRR
jgi:hypothetical protein